MERFGQAKEWIIEKLDSNAEISPLELKKLSRAELPINLQLTQLLERFTINIKRIIPNLLVQVDI